MKYLILCEGNNEKTLVDLLLDANKFIFKRDDLIGRVPFNARQLKNPTIKSQLRLYNNPVIVLRIGDKQDDKLEIPDSLSKIVTSKNVKKYCTLPELEILLIINEKLYDKFQKSHEKPKTFAKRNIVYNKKRYNQSSEFLREYYGGKRVNNLVNNIKEYKTLKKHSKDELFLADIL